MNKTQKVILAVLVVVLLGAIGFFMLTMNDSDVDNARLNNEASTESSEDASFASSDEQKTFEAIATTGESFVVQLEAEDTENDVPYSGTVSYDGQGNYLLDGQFKNDRLRFYQINDTFISCQNETCYSLTTGENGVDASTYTYSQETIQEYSNYAKYVGRSDCPAGTCDTWNVAKEGEIDATIYVADDGKISKAEGTSNSTSFVALFTYQPVTIQEPENVIESPF